MARRVRVSRRTAVKRRVRLLKDRAAVKLLREHYHGYGAKDGYPLDLKKLAKLPESRSLMTSPITPTRLLRP